MKKVLKFSYIFIKVIFMTLFILNLILFFKVDLIPINYTIIFISISVLAITFNFISDYVYEFKLLKLVSIIISLGLSILYVLVAVYINKTHNFFSSMHGEEQLETYYLAVLNDSKYENLIDLKGSKVGAYYINEDSYNKAIQNVNKNISLEIINYNDLIDLCDSLINKEIDAVLISENSKNMIEEQNELIDVQIRVMYNITTKTKVNNISKDIDVIKNPFVIYISGIDTYGNIGTVSRSDVNIICIINPNNKEILLVTIPRDYYVELYGKGSKDKLTHSGIYGIETSTKTIENLLDIDINYYIRLNFSTLVKAVDVIGGVNVYSEYTFNTYGVQFYKGYNKVNGELALAFSRARYNFPRGDRTRGENQMRVIEAIISKMSTSRVLVTNYLDILNSLEGTFQTNLEDNRIYDLVKFQLYYMPKWKVEKVSLDGFDSSNYTYSYSSGKLYVMEPDMESVNIAKEKIKEIMAN